MCSEKKRPSGDARQKRDDPPVQFVGPLVDGIQFIFPLIGLLGIRAVGLLENKAILQNRIDRIPVGAEGKRVSRYARVQPLFVHPVPGLQPDQVQRIENGAAHEVNRLFVLIAVGKAFGRIQHFAVRIEPHIRRRGRWAILLGDEPQLGVGQLESHLQP